MMVGHAFLSCDHWFLNHFVFSSIKSGSISATTKSCDQAGSFIHQDTHCIKDIQDDAEFVV